MKTGFSAQSKRQYRRDFKILTLDSKTKKTILKNVVLENKKDAKNNNIKEQKTPTGVAWKPRKKPKFKVSKRGDKATLPMLKKILNNSRAFADSNTGRLGYRSPVSARIASEHQYGARIPIKGRKNE